jgi:hypothetical protein
MAFRLDPRLAAAEIVRVLLEDLARDPEAVQTNCRKHLRINPDDLVAYARRGLTRLLRGEGAEAEEDFRELLRRGPEWSEVLRHLIDEANRRRPS